MLLLFFIKILFYIILFLISVALLTLLERKVLGLTGLRFGPNKVSLLGLLQPLGDALKLGNKQVNCLSSSSFFFYYLSSCFMLISSIFLWSLSFCSPPSVNFKFSVVFLLMFLGLNSFNSILLGWSTFSKYSLVGSLRTVSQLVSYESVLYFCLFFVICLFSCFSMFTMKFHFFFNVFLVAPVVFYVWVPSVLAELNRTPYDFSEGESELVSGFNTEFGSSSFTLIFLAEYSNILFFCLLTSFLFFFLHFHSIFLLFVFFIIWIRAVMPRFRFDKLMYLAWKFLVPFITVVFILSLIFYL